MGVIEWLHKGSLVAEFPGSQKVNLCIIIGLYIYKYIYPKRLKVTYPATKVLWGNGTRGL